MRRARDGPKGSRQVISFREGRSPRSSRASAGASAGSRLAAQDVGDARRRVLRRMRRNASVKRRLTHASVVRRGMASRRRSMIGAATTARDVRYRLGNVTGAVIASHIGIGPSALSLRSSNRPPAPSPAGAPAAPPPSVAAGRQRRWHHRSTATAARALLVLSLLSVPALPPAIAVRPRSRAAARML